MALSSGEMEWNIDMEVNLFHAMRGHKPAGVNRHFQMIAIHDKFSSSTKKVTSNDVWKHLSTLYDLQALYESEIVPFPNKNGDFALVDKDMLDLCTKSFPRSSYINSEPAKPEAPGKNISKFSTKQDGKIGSHTPKTESKSEHKSSSASKSDSRSNTPSSRSESKSSHHHSSSSGHSSSKSSHQSTPTSIPSPSPKRAKRTRNVNSASASPATPTEPQSKRRR